MSKSTQKSPAIALAALMLVLPGVAAAQEACTTYTVKDGDTLGDIAMSAYGSYNYQMIFNANRQAIGANPTNLPPGLELILPCEDGRLTADSALGAAEAHEPRANARQAVNDLVLTRRSRRFGLGRNVVAQPIARQG